MPQQLDSIASTCAPGIERNSASVASKVPKAFWWQWPCTRMGRTGLRFHGAAMRPAAISCARYSSRSCAPASRFAVASPGNIAGYSSRKVNRQEGSRPTIGVPASRYGASAAMVRRASARASSIIPAAR
jgi:hypothetical protein